MFAPTKTNGKWFMVFSGIGIVLISIQPILSPLKEAVLTALGILFGAGFIVSRIGE